LAADPTTQRIAHAWRELRRGAATATLRAHLVGGVDPSVEQSQLDALEILVGAKDGCRMSEFADAMRVDPSTATRAVDRLQRLGLVARSVDPGDRRVVVARATARGERLMHAVIARRDLGLERLLDPFDPSERQQFAEYLERLVASIDRLAGELEQPQ
jgi:DNA-binding MarR family transcriptional regulator